MSSQGRAMEAPRPRSAVRREMPLVMVGCPSSAGAERLAEHDRFNQGGEFVALCAGAPGDLADGGAVEGFYAAAQGVGENLGTEGFDELVGAAEQSAFEVGSAVEGDAAGERAGRVDGLAVF